jgi:hypothetical protein
MQVDDEVEVRLRHLLVRRLDHTAEVVDHHAFEAECPGGGPDPGNDLVLGHLDVGPEFDHAEAAKHVLRWSVC